METGDEFYRRRGVEDNLVTKRMNGTLISGEA